MKNTTKLPPFGKSLKQRILQRNYPRNGIWIYCGRGVWDRARGDIQRGLDKDREIILYPGDREPEAYDWTVCRGLDALVLHLGGMSKTILEKLLVSVVMAGANMAIVAGKDPALEVPVVRPRRMAA